MGAPRSTDLQDREKGGPGLEESPWLIDDKQMQELQELSEKWEVTTGELFRYAINQGINTLKQRDDSMKKPNT